MWMSTLKKRATNNTKDYFDNSSIQGLRYITEPNRHFSERIFWSTVCTLSLLGTYKLLLATWYTFENNAVSFVVETSYLDWNTTFAAITVCEIESPDKIFDKGNKLYGLDRNMDIDFFLRDIAFFDGTCVSCTTRCSVTINCSNDFDFIVYNMRSSCERFLKHCSWNGVPFDCCSQFLPLSTEYGECYAINSIHTESNKTKMRLFSNRFTGPGKLEFRVYEMAKIFIHSPEDVPFINTPDEEQGNINIYSIFLWRYKVFEINNVPHLRDISVDQRKCRFPDENILDVYKYYSYSTCVVDCRAKAMYKLCNCTPHLMPKLKGAKICDVDGLSCLTEYSKTVRVLKSKDSDRDGLACDCMPSCFEPEYTIVGNAKFPNDEDTDLDLTKDPSVVVVKLDSLPTQRFQRNVIRTPLDLVVSMGGTAGLFLGASLLSLVELGVFIFLRKENKQMSFTSKEKEVTDTTTDKVAATGDAIFMISQSSHGYPRYKRHSSKTSVFPFLH